MLQRASYAVEAELIGFTDMPPLVELDEQVRHLNLTILGAREDDELVGILGYRRTAGVVEIERLAVHPSRFRQGLAGSLIAALHEREADARRFEVSTGAANIPAIALYTRLGYHRETSHVVARGLTLVRLARP